MKNIDYKNLHISIITLLYQLTSNCNMACKYCYVGSNKMCERNANVNGSFASNYSNLSKFVDQLLDYNNKPSRIIFHGGEPLLINIDNWRMMLEDFRKKDPNTKFSIQTNGTLLTDDILALFKEYNMELGVSLDGPEHY